MKTRIFLVVSILAVSIMCVACMGNKSIYEETAETMVLLYLRESGTEAANQHIDKLVEKGKLTPVQGEQLKAIIANTLSDVQKVLTESK